MQRLEVSGAVRPIYGSLGVKGLNRRLCGPHSWSGSYAKQKDSIRPPGFEPRIVKPAESPQQFASPATVTRTTPCLATYQ